MKASVIKLALLSQIKVRRNVLESANPKAIYVADRYNDGGRIYFHIFPISMESYFGGIFRHRVYISAGRLMQILMTNQ
jgi:hypothetical protein